MRAITFDGKISLVKDYPLPVQGVNEALIRVHMAGICNTDIEIMRGYQGFSGVIGHEFVGRVEKAHGQAAHMVGQRVVGEINCSCGLCDYCRKGFTAHCPNRTTLGIRGRNGALADYVSLPLSNLHLIPDELSDEEAIFTEPLAAAFEITEQIQVKPTDRIAVLGDGKLGLLCSFVLSLTGADLTLVGKHEAKLSVARRRGIRTVDTATNELPVERVHDIIIEATGSTGGLDMALGLVKPRGTVVLKSTVAARKEMNLSRIVIDEITLLGSRCGPFQPAIRALSQRRIDVKQLISGIFGFEEGEKAFRKALEKESLKIIVDFR